MNKISNIYYIYISAVIWCSGDITIVHIDIWSGGVGDFSANNIAFLFPAVQWQRFNRSFHLPPEFTLAWNIYKLNVENQ